MGTTSLLMASSANSRRVQWLISRPDSHGYSQARATIWTSCSGLNVSGAPERGASASVASTNAVSSLSVTLLASAASKIASAANQRSRHVRAVSVSMLSCRATAALLGSVQTEHMCYRFRLDTFARTLSTIAGHSVRSLGIAEVVLRPSEPQNGAFSPILIPVWPISLRYSVFNRPKIVSHSMQKCPLN